MYGTQNVWAAIVLYKRANAYSFFLKIINILTSQNICRNKTFEWFLLDYNGSNSNRKDQPNGKQNAVFCHFYNPNSILTSF